MIHSLRKNNGFTLVEMMVAISVFSIVMVVAMGALINVIDADLKAQAIKTAIDNVNFALESISKEMRVGTDYQCLDGTGVPISSCDNVNGNLGVRYISSRKDENGDNIPISYLFIPASGPNTQGRIQRDIEVPNQDQGFQDMTSSEVDIKKMRFYVAGNDLNLVPREQPRVVITLTGEAGQKAKIKTSFDLQTSVSQRARVSQ